MAIVEQVPGLTMNAMAGFYARKFEADTRKAMAVNERVLRKILLLNRDSEYGTLGLLQSANSLGLILGPVAGGALYDVHINIPYLSGALIMFLTAAVLWLKLARFGSPSPSPGN
ncbi:hypothetical protein SAMN02745218_02190 [Desulfofundulus australicus DSM 11792]|uniref:Major Facilitator Superfamily protein n=1 Tax=Desulfofundulus australicus DSM 11792 TaxID=1121425 RepID=A0A1M5BFU0_9FIRM|nr:hypothetical protein [Desulfofundulus australicus]SHF41381.1 hypothetical protein SAMN02745218_02190 [Desulfofundulus australicus DSM 11792]